VVIGVGFARESGDDIRAEAKDREPLGEPFDPGAIGFRRVPMPAHALEDAVRARLKRRVQMRGEMTRRFDEEPGERVVDFGGFDGPKAKSHRGDGFDQSLDEIAK